MTVGKPLRQVCPICSTDDDVALVPGDDPAWQMICTSSDHETYLWTPTVEPTHLQGRSGLGEELSVYVDLSKCLEPGLFLEHGVIEHRFAEVNSTAYRTLVDRFGHTAFGKRRYSASSFLGGALSLLSREGAVARRRVKPTGFWSYNPDVGAAGPSSTPEDAPLLSWAMYAEQELGIDPMSWPALGYTP